jgi:predicted MFS family arabinose efflux permease
VFHNVAFSHLAGSAERGSLGKTLGNFTAIGDVGRIPLASLAGFVAAMTVFGVPGWRAVCLVYGTGALIFAGLVFSTTAAGEEAGQAVRPRPSGGGGWLPSFALLRGRQAALSMTASVLDALGSNAVFVFLPFLLFAKGIDPKILGAFALAFTFGSFLGKAVLGRMVDRFGTRGVFVLSEYAQAVLLVILILAQQLPAIIGASLLLGIVTKGTVPVVQAIIAEPMREPHQRGEIIAVNSLLRGLTGIAAPVVLGMIGSAFGIAWSFGAMALVVACAPLPFLLMSRRELPLPQGEGRGEGRETGLDRQNARG